MVVIEEIPNNLPPVIISNPTVSQPNPFLNGVLNAYRLLADHPVTLIIFIVAILAIVAESNNTNGPFEILKESLTNYISKTEHPAFVRSLASLVLAIVNFILKFKSKIFVLLTLIIIPVSYPNRDTTVVLLLLISYILINKHSLYINFIIIQLIFVYYSLTSFIDKLILFIIIIYLVFGSENINLMFTH